METARPFAVYVHIPFCQHKCPYCDFVTIGVLKPPELEYVAAITSELKGRAEDPRFSGRLVSSIFFGGGTPSFFSASSIAHIIGLVRELFPVEEGIEISLEANPSKLDGDKLDEFGAAGVNRLSFGVQSFNDETLKTLGRKHTSSEARDVVRSAKRKGFRSINLDLLYGAPDQTLFTLINDIREFLLLEPEHISAYCLTLEKGTPFYQSVGRGVLTIPNDETTASMMETINEELPLHGYGRYEISNFSKPTYQCRHNLTYWGGGDYLGIGAGAHSYYSYYSSGGSSATRWSNQASVPGYLENISRHGTAEAWHETLSAKDLQYECFFTGLRKTEGVGCAEFLAKFGVSIEQVLVRSLEPLLREGFLMIEGDSLRFSKQGMLLADSVLERLLEDF